MIKAVDIHGDHRLGLYVALVFARDVTPVKPKVLVIVNINRLDHGVVAGVIVDGKIVKWLKLPDVSVVKELKRLHQRVRELEKRAAREIDPAGRARLEEEVGRLKSKRFGVIRDAVVKMAKELVGLAVKYHAAIVVDGIDERTYSARKQSGEGGARKHLYDGLGQLRRRLQRLAQWYGLPYREVRLYSTVCPRCGAKMREAGGRRMQCPACGFSDHRDNIPIYWAKRRYWEILQKQPVFSAITLLTRKFLHL
ncbi:zinc ribbon domain-containing protein [Pyrobaculum islandicum]|uniref:zinc ribbon domain-containing protein n=1 Tax=Pyrobaculum islandicum TaxID=2277 RepID=UPI001432DD85